MNYAKDCHSGETMLKSQKVVKQTKSLILAQSLIQSYTIMTRFNIAW